VSLLVAGHADLFFKLLAYLAACNPVSREAALIYAFASFKANDPLKNPDGSAVESTKLANTKSWNIRGQLEIRKYTRSAVRVAARQRKSIDAAWVEACKPGSLRKAPGDFRYAYETVKSKAAVSQEARILGALTMIATTISLEDNDREERILDKLYSLSPMARFRRLLKMEGQGPI
jgi:hypothetical protein